jgi:hypothetical protein
MKYRLLLKLRRMHAHCMVHYSVLVEIRGKQDGIQSWYPLVNQYETDGNRNVRIKKLENIITTDFHRHYKGGLFQYKTMKMHSQNLLYLVKQLGMMMILRNVVWFRMLKLLAWLILFLKH